MNERYGGNFHPNWCTHTAYLALWNITRSRVDNEKPDYIFEINSCLNTVAFSETETALIAAGTISGKFPINT